MLPLLFALLPSATAADVKVLQDSRSEKAPGQVRFVEKKGHSLSVGLVTASDTQAAGNVIVMQKLYDPLCEAPCSLEMKPGWYEFRFAHEDTEWFRKLEVKSGPQTYTIKRWRRGMNMSGVLLSAFMILPVGVPLWVASMPTHKWSPGM